MRSKKENDSDYISYKYNYKIAYKLDCLFLEQKILFIKNIKKVKKVAEEKKVYTPSDYFRNDLIYDELRKEREEIQHKMWSYYAMIKDLYAEKLDRKQFEALPALVVLDYSDYRDKLIAELSDLQEE